MKTRLSCLLLCLIMVLSVFLTACGSSGENATTTGTGEPTQAEVESAMTLTMWVVTENENGVDSETAAAVSRAVNTITNARFTTRLVLRFLTESEYRSVLDSTIRSYVDNRYSSGIVEEETTAPETDENGETLTFVQETETNEWGQTVIKYPDLIDNQVDIIYIQGEDMYLEYINNGWLAELDEELNSSSKKIKEYVNNALLAAAKKGGSTYAIPNNHVIGEYTFMLLNKALMQETSMDAIYKQGKIKGLFNDYVYNYLETIRYKIQVNGLTDLIPIAASYQECLDFLAYYWNINPDTLENEGGLSLIGYYYNNPTALSRSNALRFDTLFTNNSFKNAFLKLNEYRLAGGYFQDAPSDKTAAIEIKKGSYNDYLDYLADDSDYYPVILRNPTVEANDVYDSMFGVCRYTRDVGRSMAIVTYLNTNAEFRNLLQYGVEDVTYRLDPDPANPQKKTVVPLDDHPYKMDIFKTGNAFIAYPAPTMSEDVWEKGKLQNLAVVGANPMLDLNFRQIAQSSVEEDVMSSSGASGYSYRFRTGLSKEVLSQNELLDEWIKSCDAKGKGIYLYQATVEESQNITNELFYYNSNGGTTASAYEDTANKVLGIAYTSGSGASYELSYLKIFSRKNANVTLTSTVDGSSVGLNVSRHYALINFDFMNTEHFSVLYSANLAKTVIHNQASSTAWQWVKANESSGEVPTKFPQVLSSVKVTGDGDAAQKKFTYLVYVKGMEYNHEVTVSTRGDATNPTVDITLNETAKALGNDDPTYALLLVNVLTDASVTGVNYHFVFNGDEVEPNVTEQTEDIGLLSCGTLDTSMVRYIYEMNKDLVALVDGCATLDEVKALVEEVAKMMNTKELLDEYSFMVLSDFLTKYGVLNTQYIIKAYTSTSAVKHLTETEDNEGNPKLGTEDTDYAANEAFVLMDSPFTLYNAWLVSNGYISKK